MKAFVSAAAVLRAFGGPAQALKLEWRSEREWFEYKAQRAARRLMQEAQAMAGQSNLEGVGPARCVHKFAQRDFGRYVQCEFCGYQAIDGREPMILRQAAEHSVCSIGSDLHHRSCERRRGGRQCTC